MTSLPLVEHRRGAPQTGCSMRHGGGAVLVDQRAGRETFEAEGPRQRVRLVMGNRMGEDMAGARGRLEPARAPAALPGQAPDPPFARARGGGGPDPDEARPAR